MELNPFIALHVFLYKLTGGKIGGKIRKAPVLLLTTAGRRSGKNRTTPVLFLQREHDWVVVASNAGRPKNPNWYHNLREDPAGTIRVRGQVLEVRARQALAGERVQIWPLLVEMYSSFDDYQKKTSRRIPVLILESASPGNRTVTKHLAAGRTGQ